MAGEIISRMEFEIVRARGNNFSTLSVTVRSGFSRKLSIESRDILFFFFLEGGSEIDGITLLLAITCLEILLGGGKYLSVLYGSRNLSKSSYNHTLHQIRTSRFSF